MKHAGIATLPVILLISGIVMELTIAGVIIASLITSTIFSERLSAEALAAARSGAQDAIVKIIRYNCSSFISGCPSENPDSPDVVVLAENRTAEVYIAAKTPIGDGVRFTVSSVGIAATNKKKIEALVEVSASSGKVSVVSFKEVPLPSQ